MKILKFLLLNCFILTSLVCMAQNNQEESKTYKKRVLDATEVDILSSFYGQSGENAAVSGGRGTEELTDFTATYIISIPLNDDDILTIDAGISAYTSASSSNVDPFDKEIADPFLASTGASSSDVWINLNGSYSHSSDDRNTIWSGKASISNEYDFFSLGVGGSFTKLFNEKNTEIGVGVNAFFDSWRTIYPFELRPFANDGLALNDELFTNNMLIGNLNYTPDFNEFAETGRNSYSGSLSFSQILHKNVQGTLSLDFISQQGLLSTPFQRVYFADIEDTFIDNFQLADAIENLPDSRTKIAFGSRINWYLNEYLTMRTYYRYYSDLDKAIEGCASEEFSILMSHDPVHWEKIVLNHAKHIHLTLSGHTHGMQMGIERLGIKWSPIQYFYKYWAGLYKELNQYLYVNRGFGFMGFAGRIGIQPEITTFTLKTKV